MQPHTARWFIFNKSLGLMISDLFISIANFLRSVDEIMNGVDSASNGDKWNKHLWGLLLLM